MSIQKVLEETRRILRLQNKSYETEKCYLGWINRYLVFFRNGSSKPPRDMAVSEFLSHLAVQRHCSVQTQKQALNALVFFYRHVVKAELGKIPDFAPAAKPRRLPVVLTREETWAILDRLEGITFLVTGLLYGGGLRRIEALRLRVKDIDFEKGESIVREGKGGKDRVTMEKENGTGPF